MDNHEPLFETSQKLILSRKINDIVSSLNKTLKNCYNLGVLAFFITVPSTFFGAFTHNEGTLLYALFTLCMFGILLGLGTYAFWCFHSKYKLKQIISLINSLNMSEKESFIHFLLICVVEKLNHYNQRRHLIDFQEIKEVLTLDINTVFDIKKHRHLAFVSELIGQGKFDSIMNREMYLNTTNDELKELLESYFPSSIEEKLKIIQKENHIEPEIEKTLKHYL